MTNISGGPPQKGVHIFWQRNFKLLLFGNLTTDWAGIVCQESTITKDEQCIIAY